MQIWGEQSEGVGEDFLFPRRVVSDEGVLPG